MLSFIVLYVATIAVYIFIYFLKYYLKDLLSSLLNYVVLKSMRLKPMLLNGRMLMVL